VAVAVHGQGSSSGGSWQLAAPVAREQGARARGQGGGVQGWLTNDAHEQSHQAGAPAQAGKGKGQVGICRKQWEGTGQERGSCDVRSGRGGTSAAAGLA